MFMELKDLKWKKDLSGFDKGHIVLARQMGQNFSERASLVFCSWSAVERIYKQSSEEGQTTNWRYKAHDKDYKGFPGLSQKMVYCATNCTKVCWWLLEKCLKIIQVFCVGHVSNLFNVLFS